MAKKKPVTKKKTAAAKKKAPVAKKKISAAEKNVQSQKKLLPSGSVDEYRVELLPLSALETIRETIETAMSNFQTMADNNLTTIQRRRKIGAGVRNYGFMEKVVDLAEANTQFAQFFDPNDLRNAILNFDMCRDLALLLQSFVRSVTNTMLIYSNEGFIMSSMFYNTVKEMSRRGDPTANALFNTLQSFFKRPRRPSSKATVKQTEKDIHSVLIGAKEGKVIIENITPKLTGGGRKIIDDVHKSTLAIKENINEQETE